MRIGPLSWKAAQAASEYLRKHPEEVFRAAKNVASFKVGVPVAALRWLFSELGGDKVPEDLEIEARSPGIHLRATVELMRTPLKASGTIVVERVDASEQAILVDVRLLDLALDVLDPSAGTPIAALLQSGALDLSRPGDLLSYIPKRPPTLVDAKGDRLTFDLMKHPKLSAERARKLVGLLVPLVGIDAIATEGKHLDVAFSAFPRGAREAFESWRRAL